MIKTLIDVHDPTKLSSPIHREIIEYVREREKSKKNGMHQLP